MIFVNILLGLVGGILLVGVIGEEDKYRQKNITLAFVALLLFTVALNLIL